MSNSVLRADRASTVKGQKVLFDTNIWMLINGFNQGAPQRKVDIYSSAYDDLLRNENEILVNDYVVGEFCNACARIEHKLHCSRTIADADRSFKNLRKDPVFLPALEVIRDYCFDIIDYCTYIPSGGPKSASDAVSEFCRGGLDFSDVAIRDFCAQHEAILMTDDGDYADSGINIITYNQYILKHSAYKVV